MSEDKLKHSCTRLNDLPNEILMIIFKYLHHHHVLYSFININKRFDTIINDTIIGKKLTLISFNDSSCPFNNKIFDRFRSQILPSIHHKIQWINLESSITERILLSTKYPNLNALGLYDLALETASDLFADGSYLFHHFGQQISTLFINMKGYVPQINSFEDKKILEDRKIFQLVFKQNYLTND